MKRKKKAKKIGFLEGIKRFLLLLETNIVFIYLFCMLVIFPLFYVNKYHGIGSAKYDFFAKTSLVFLIAEIVLIAFMAGVQVCRFFKRKKEESSPIKLPKVSFLCRKMLFDVGLL